MAVFFPPVIMFFMEIESVAGEKINWFQKLLTFYTSPVSKFTYGTVSCDTRHHQHYLLNKDSQQPQDPAAFRSPQIPKHYI